MRTLKQKQATKRNFYIMLLLGMVATLNKMQCDCKDDVLKDRIKWAKHTVEFVLLNIKAFSAHIWGIEEDIEK